MKRRQNDDGHVNMTPMIDVVFQLIIFFVVTIQLDKEAVKEEIELSWARDAKQIEKQDPRTLTIQVDDSGRIFLGKAQYTARMITGLLRRLGPETPVFVRADVETKHGYVQRAVDACVAAGVWKVSFVAKKDDAK
jgi:biopolymer transport protein ExbD